MRRCIIHIGHAKTGSTYLQHCLHLNAELFARHNYWLPAEFTAFGFYDLAPLSVAGAVISGNLAPLHELMCSGPGEQVTPMHDYLFDAPGMPGDCDVLLSSELFFYYVGALSKLIGAAQAYGLAPEVVAYLPRQDHGAVSGYLQNVRYHGYAAGPIEFLVHDQNIRYCDYQRALFRLVALAPGVPITLRTSDRAFLHGHDVLVDFLTTIQCRVDAADCRRPAAASNQGLTLEHYELLRAAALLQRPDAASVLRDDEVALTDAERRRTAAYYYRPALRNFLTQHYLGANQALLERLMPGIDAAEAAYWAELGEVSAPVALDRDLFETLRQRAFG